MTNLEQALTVVRAAGYRVSKPRSKSPKKKTDVGPTFVAQFADGEVTRMSIFTTLADLDLGRGVRLACAAYDSRKRQRAIGERLADAMCDEADAQAASETPSRQQLDLTERRARAVAVAERLKVKVPLIVEGRFEQNGKTLATYSARDLAAAA
jgi:hypothetical protein